ncbi:MAG: SGNH/GDSL hydrolase family protein, partial [ANME-2 cluster archaeon]|nr:SGNH/GDSL hydrolase family protein [ANME-2 cluster archaeon]
MIIIYYYINYDSYIKLRGILMRHTRVILLIFVIIAFLVNPVSALSKVAPYDPIPIQEGANVGGYREFIATGHDSRIRQNGDINEIRLGIKDYDNIEVFYFTIWRRNTEGTTESPYDKIYSTGNIRGSLIKVSDCIYEYTFTVPLEDVQEGDFYGYGIKTTKSGDYIDALYAFEKGNTEDDSYPYGPNHQTYFKNLSGSYPEVLDGFYWEDNADGYSDDVFVIECYMDNPYMIFIGNSIIAGFGYPDEHYSFIEPQPVTDPTGTISYQWSNLDGDKSYQNMGINGDYIDEIDSRFVKDAVDLNPQYILIEGGVNDINRGSDADYVMNYWGNMINKTYYADPQIIPVILLILPYNNYYLEQQYKLDRINAVNAELIEMAKDYPGSIVVDARDYVGFPDDDGYWRIDPDKTSDDWLHYNRVGNQAIAQAIYDAMHANAGSISGIVSYSYNGNPIGDVTV